MDAISQRTRSRKGVEAQETQETQDTQETQETQEKTGYETDVGDIADIAHAEDTKDTEDAEDTEDTMEITQLRVRDSMEDRMDNYVGAMLYTAIHYPRFFVAVWVLVFMALSVLAASTQKRAA